MVASVSREDQAIGFATWQKLASVPTEAVIVMQPLRMPDSIAADAIAGGVRFGNFIDGPREVKVDRLGDGAVDELPLAQIAHDGANDAKKALDDPEPGHALGGAFEATGVEVTKRRIAMRTPTPVNT